MPYLIVLLILIGFYFYLVTGTEKQEPEKKKIKFEGRVKVAVLNGCGYPGIAKEVKDYLVENYNSNIDVLDWRNVDMNRFIYERSILVVKKRDNEKLEFLKELTGINRRIIALNSEVNEEFQIILGKDFHTYFK
ncbi:MAG: LytR C-terminal domain-containing protein [Candidatus Cloacimonadota bacterium]|nr:LytR C-terminal domain-containing protein [Candidatus Cloacimonadota bacterium]